jgi:hypothetical protein
MPGLVSRIGPKDIRTHRLEQAVPMKIARQPVILDEYSVERLQSFTNNVNHNLYVGPVGLSLSQ